MASQFRDDINMSKEVMLRMLLLCHLLFYDQTSQCHSVAKTLDCMDTTGNLVPDQSKVR